MESAMKRWMLTAAMAVAAAGALAACETQTPYQPLEASAVGPSGGYSEARVDDNRWRVSFRGNEATSRDVVETDMLYRAAELTLAQGYDWFEGVQRRTDTHTEGYVTDPWGPYGGPWAFHRRWFWGDPFWDDVTFSTASRYDATIEIVLHHGQKPAEDNHAFDARQVIANLGPRILRPPPTR
jgi:hypothetical protein